MPYNTTFFPNMLEHYDQDIAAIKMKVRFGEGHLNLQPSLWIPVSLILIFRPTSQLVLYNITYCFYTTIHKKIYRIVDLKIKIDII